MTAAELIAYWDQRDYRYTLRRHHGLPMPITPAEESIIRIYREAEINRLPPNERGPAWRALQSWRP